MATTPPPGCPIARRHRSLAETSLESCQFACKATLAEQPIQPEPSGRKRDPFLQSTSKRVAAPLCSWQAHRETHRRSSRDNWKEECGCATTLALTVIDLKREDGGWMMQVGGVERPVQ